MISKRREKIIAMLTGAAVALLALDQYAVMPYLDAKARVEADLEVAREQQAEANRLLENRARVARAWAGLLASGLKEDPAAAESQALHRLRDCGQNSRVDLQGVKPERVGRVGDFAQVRLQATGVGTTAAIARMLELIETSEIPMKISDLRITSRKEGNDDLSFALGISTLVFSPAPEKPKPAAKGETK